MWVAFISTSGALTLNKYDRLAIINGLVTESSTVIKTPVASWANPSLFVVSDELLCLIYENSEGFV